MDGSKTYLFRLLTSNPCEMVTLSITVQDLFEFDTDHISRSYYDEIEELSENLSLNCNLIVPLSLNYRLKMTKP